MLAILKQRGIGLFLPCTGFGKGSWEEETVMVFGKKEPGTAMTQHWTVALMAGQVLVGGPITNLGGLFSTVYAQPQ